MRKRLRPLIAALAMALLLGPLASTARAEPPSPYRSPGMRIAGIVLTSIASAILTAGLVGGTVFSFGHGEAVNVVFFASGAGGSLPLAAAGIPLWVLGARPRHTAGTASPRQTVTLRPLGLGFAF
jgi:hypothetical protein